jgi:homoserine kinase type II
MLKGDRRQRYRNVFLHREHLSELWRQFAMPEEPRTMELLDGGEDNVNLLLRDTAGRGVAVARHYLVTASDKIAAELQFVDFLADHGYPTPRPIPTRQGSLFANNGPEPSIALFPFVNGVHYDSWSGAQRRVGAGILATMHGLCAGEHYLIGRTKDHRNILETGFHRVAATDLGDKVVFLREVEHFLAVNFDAGMNVLRTLPFGPVHHDLNTGNVLWGNENRIAALIDFDEAHDAPSIMDLVTAFQYLASDDGGLLDLPKCEDVFQGYDHWRPILDRERSALQFCWDLTVITGAMEYISENAACLNSVMECLSFSQLYLRNRDRLAGYF